MTDKQLLELLRERPIYKAPDLFDEELAQLVVERGRQQVILNKKLVRRIVWITSLSFLIVSFFARLAGFDFLGVATLALIAYYIFGTAVGFHRAARVVNSFKNHQYSVTHKLLADAIWWNANWYPFTIYPLFKCQNIELAMLLSEGRILELEVYTRYCLSFLKPDPEEKSRYWVRFRNNLWVSRLISGRYAEAIEGFSSCDLTTVRKQMRPILLNNLALAQIKNGDAQTSQETLNRAFAEIKGTRLSPLNTRLEYIQSVVYLQQDDLENAEAAVEKTERLTEKFPDEELRAECMITRGRIRQKQGRFEESKLYFKNGIEMFSNSDNTPYLNLCFAMHYYAQMLMESGDEQYALALMHKVDEYMELYRIREERTCERIKQRLVNASKLRTASDLLTLGEREGHVELITTR